MLKTRAPGAKTFLQVNNHYMMLYWTGRLQLIANENKFQLKILIIGHQSQIWKTYTHCILCFCILHQLDCHDELDHCWNCSTELIGCRSKPRTSRYAISYSNWWIYINWRAWCYFLCILFQHGFDFRLDFDACCWGKYINWFQGSKKLFTYNSSKFFYNIKVSKYFRSSTTLSIILKIPLVIPNQSSTSFLAGKRQKETTKTATSPFGHRVR